MNAAAFERHRCGFSLVEVVIAVGVAATGLIVILALLPGLLRQNADAKETMVALGLSDSIAIELNKLSGGNPASLAAQAAAFDATTSPLRLVAAGNGTDLRVPGSDSRSEYFLIELHRFPAGSALAHVAGDPHVNLQARISWPYRPVGAGGAEVPRESRQRVKYGVLIRP